MCTRVYVVKGHHRYIVDVYRHTNLALEALNVVALVQGSHSQAPGFTLRNALINSQCMQ